MRTAVQVVGLLAAAVAVCMLAAFELRRLAGLPPQTTFRLTLSVVITVFVTCAFYSLFRAVGAA